MAATVIIQLVLTGPSNSPEGIQLAISEIFDNGDLVLAVADLSSWLKPNMDMKLFRQFIRVNKQSSVSGDFNDEDH